MTDSYSRTEKIVLEATRKAIDAIEDSCIKRDIMHFVAGAEVCLELQEVHLALDCVSTVVTTVVALNRTISPEVTVGVLDGLHEDSETTAKALRRGLGFTSNKDQKCGVKDAEPGGGGAGKSTCVSDPGGKCYTFGSGSGCGGTSGFQFVWEAALKV